MVIEGGLDPEYVLDKMQMYELKPLISNLHRKDKENWEQARFIAYMVAQVNSSKSLKPVDILRFPWDMEDKEKGNTSISNEDIERLKEKAKQFINNN